MFLTFPTQDEWNQIAQTYPHDELRVPDCFFHLESFDGRRDELSKFVDIQDAETWARHLVGRLGDVYISYVMLMFYFHKGIPDDEWWISPGKSGSGVDYFPHFEEDHHLIHKQFSYYADIFFYKIFTSWDTVGQFLNSRFELGIEKQNVSFKNAVKALKASKPVLCDQLATLIGGVEFFELSEIRNSIAHRFSPNSVDSGIVVRKTDKSTSVDVTIGNYKTSKQVKEAVEVALGIMGKTLHHIRSALS